MFTGGHLLGEGMYLYGGRAEGEGDWRHLLTVSRFVNFGFYHS